MILTHSQQRLADAIIRDLPEPYGRAIARQAADELATFAADPRFAATACLSLTHHSCSKIAGDELRYLGAALVIAHDDYGPDAAFAVITATIKLLDERARASPFG
jgi:hypothetical protein